MNGTLYLVGTDFLSKPSINGDSIKNAGNLKNEKITEMLKQADDLYLTSADVLKLKWSSNDIKLSLWDGSKVDQDKISVIVNDKIILENFIISKEKKVISIPFTEDVCKIVILAVNEGLLIS